MFAIIGSMLLGSAAGHMIMNTPVPYNPHHVQVSPLDGLKYTFPCQGDFSDPPADTPITAGGHQTVKFTGSAVHGGGSCQFSVNYDSPPSADPTRWKTIFSIIGGCPADAPGNVKENGEDADFRIQGVQCGNSVGKNCTRQYDIPIPKDLPNGRASFAWTWFNKIGKREMYMNCAPVVISGGAKDTTFLESLPSIFVANYPGTCTVGSREEAINLPNPGRFGAILGPFVENNLGDCSHATVPRPSFPTTMAVASSASSAPSSGSNSSISVSVTAAAASSPSAPPTGTAGGVFITSPPSASLGLTTTATLASDTVSPSRVSPPLDPATTVTLPSGTASLSPSSSTPGSSPSAPAASNTPETSSVAPETPTASATMTVSATIQASETTTVSEAPTAAVASETAIVPKPSTGAGPSDGSKTACSPDGSLICMDDGFFGLCDHGFAVRQQLAAGTSCKDGKIVKRSYRAYPVRRNKDKRGH